MLVPKQCSRWVITFYALRLGSLGDEHQIKAEIILQELRILVTAACTRCSSRQRGSALDSSWVLLSTDSKCSTILVWLLLKMAQFVPFFSDWTSRATPGAIILSWTKICSSSDAGLIIVFLWRLFGDRHNWGLVALMAKKVLEIFDVI